MKNIIQRFLPKKNHFIGIDIGVYEIKAAEVKIIDGVPEVVSLRRHPAPPGVWTDQFDEESLVQALKEVANPRLKEVITCIGGERVVSRIVRLPQMPGKEMEAAVKFEIQKFVPTPVDQLIIRHVPLEGIAGDQEKDPKIKIYIPRSGETREISGKQEEGQDVLLLAVPAATVYQYHSIFSRAGLVVTAVDLQAFALWRVFGRTVQGTVAIADIGAKTSHLVLVKDGVIKFVRLLPAGGNVLTNIIMDRYGVELSDALKMIEESAVEPAKDQEVKGGVQTIDPLKRGLLQQMDEVAAVSPEEQQNIPLGLQFDDIFQRGLLQQVDEVAAVSLEGYYNRPRGLQLSNILREGLQEMTKELRRSLEFYSNQENVSAERLILCGGTSKVKGLTDYLQDALDIPVEVGIPEVDFSGDEVFDPAFVVAIGLALREAI